MVAKAAPGDLLEVTTVAERHDYSIAQIDRVVRAGPARRVPPCPYADRCGGCDWQQISYAAQLEIKAGLIAAGLGRALRADISPDGLLEPAEAEFGYRSRVRFQAEPRGGIGFHEPSGNRLVEVDRCLVAADTIAVPKTLAMALAGHCSGIEVIDDGAGGQVLVIDFAKKPTPGDVTTVNRCIANDPAIRGAVLVGGGQRQKVGDPAIAIELEPGLTINFDGDLFSQVNRSLNRRMIEYVMGLADPGPTTTILDLFCGAGNFSLPAARRGAQVTGVDSVNEAIEAARRSARILGFGDRAQFIAMKAADTARFLGRANYHADTVILDPPRAGANLLVASLIRLRPARIVYVSCNVATLARDLSAIAGGGYGLGALRAFDLFPNTHHVEVIAEMLLT